jgi:hypothetical protein
MPDVRGGYGSRKTIVLLSSRIDAVTALNVTGHLCLAIGANAYPAILGRRRLVDGSGGVHLGISKFPIIVLAGRPSKIEASLAAAHGRPELLVADYPRQMLDTGSDEDLAVALGDAHDLEYLGIAVYGPTGVLDDVFGRFSLWGK